MEFHADRYALLLMDGMWPVPHMDHRMVETLQQWWLHTQPPLLQRWAQASCWYCGAQPTAPEPALGSDHAFPEAYALTPLVPCCRRCNSLKGHATPNESRRRWPGSVYWFEAIGLAASPLGCTLREDRMGLRAVVFWYLLDTGQGA
jgi:hypothetical protein